MIDFIKKLAREAGEILLEGYGISQKEISHKGLIDLVTASDLKSEEFLTQEIKSRYPDDLVLAEERSYQIRDGNRIWIIDPLDGTTNFAHGFPFFAVSIALEISSIINFGVVYNPYFKEMFWAEKGKGAFLNDQPIHVSATSILRESLLATGFPYDRWEKGEFYIKEYQAFMQRSQGVRRAGSASIDLCYLAAGRFDGFFERKLKPWDTAAGSLIIDESGGSISQFSGSKWDCRDNSIIASNGLIHEQMIKVLTELKHNREGKIG